MGGIFTKCPKCGSDAILRYIEPDFKKGVFKRIFICKNGHEFKEEIEIAKERKWMREIIEGLKII